MRANSLYRKTSLLILGPLTLSMLSCGGTSSSDPQTGAPDGDTQVLSITVSNGQVWQVNRPIDIQFDRDIQIATAHLGSIRIEDSSGQFAQGHFFQPSYPDGELRRDTVRFQPNCPTDLFGTGAGFNPGGVLYRLTVGGTDQGNQAVVGTDFVPVSETVVVQFSTASTGTPGGLFYDAITGPPRIRVRGANGVSASDFDTTHLEVGAWSQTPVYFLQPQLSNIGTIDPAYAGLLPNGLPLNHSIVPDHQIAFVVHFDQPLNPLPANLEHVQVEYFDGTWQPLQSRVELVSNCLSSGSAVRVSPIGMFPLGTLLRVIQTAGLEDLTQEASGFDSVGRVQVRTTSIPSGPGARVDGYFEGFGVGGTAPGSTEDTLADFTEEPAFWGQSTLIPEFTANGESRARSKWSRLGLGSVNPVGANSQPRFFFGGTDTSGVVQTTGTQINALPAVITSVPIDMLEAQSVRIRKTDLAGIDDVYLAQPGLMNGFYATLAAPGLGVQAEARIGFPQDEGEFLRLTIYQPCLDTGDCVPLDLTQAFGGSTGVTLTITPRFFDFTTNFEWGALTPDSRVTITFDATMADASGQPDPQAAYSLIHGWQPDIEALNGTAWDFVRFEVFFEMDVSGDGWLAGSPRPKMRTLLIPFDFRQ